MFLVGTKADLSSVHRKVTCEEGIKFKEDNRQAGIVYFAETSAKTGHNVQNLFVDIAKMIYI